MLTSFISIKRLSSQIWKHCVRSKKSSICEFGQLRRLPEREKCIMGSLSLIYKLSKISFLTTFISTKTLHDHWSILKYRSEICQIFEFFEYEKFWRLLGGERCILESWSWRSMLFKMTFLTTFISIIKLYDQIWQNYFF